MAQARHLRNPPIQEAVMEFHFSGAALDRAVLELLAEPFVKEQWTRQEINTFSATLGPLENEPQSVSLMASPATFEGFLVFDEGRRHVVQFRSDRVTVSNVRSYDTWEALEAQAERAFEAFVKRASPKSVDRISSRFINRIPPDVDFTHYQDILERPPLPLEGLDEAKISDFLRRHVIENLAGGLTANLTIGTVLPEPGEVTSNTKGLVVDIDVFKTCRLNPSFEVIKQEMSQVRRIKNALFFGSLKESVLEKFV